MMNTPQGSTISSQHCTEDQTSTCIWGGGKCIQMVVTVSNQLKQNGTDEKEYNEG